MVIYVNKQLFSLEAPMCVIDDERRLFSTYTTKTALRTFIRGPSEAEAKKRSHRTMFDRSAQKRPLLFFPTSSSWRLPKPWPSTSIKPWGCKMSCNRVTFPLPKGRKLLIGVCNCIECTLACKQYLVTWIPCNNSHSKEFELSKVDF